MWQRSSRCGRAQLGTIAGTVAASANGRPVAEAVVTVEGTALFAVTTAVGRFVLEGVAVGSRMLIVQAPGFLDLRVPSVQVGPDTPVSLRIQLDFTPNCLERVQVTASKALLSIVEVAAQADIVDRSTIEERRDQRLTDAIAHVPGVMVSTQAGSFESVTLRGLPRDGNEFTSTLLLIDGVPQTDSRNSARVVNLPITDASSIEVVRGPNSALYRRTAVGGSVNVRTADPTPDHQTGFDITGGEFGLCEGIFYGGSRLEVDGDLGGVETSIIAGGSYEYTSGFGAGNLMYTVADTFGWPLNYLAPVHPAKSD